MTINEGNILASFRDPSGYVFCKNGAIYRQINISYKDNYDHLINSGLYKNLSDSGLLIPHSEVKMDNGVHQSAYKIIKPEAIPYISYPYEWCFSQIKDAALLTLEIQRKALGFGMTLKDSSVYNIQFLNGKPIFIDTLSFDKYNESSPWDAYKQFCQHFLAPLALMGFKDIRFNQLFRVYLDGIPLDLASSLLPLHTYLKFSLVSHIHFHAKSQNYFADKPIAIRKYNMSRLHLLGLIDNLTSAVKKIKLKKRETEWIDYYTDTNYSSNAFQDKIQRVSGFIDIIKPKTVWDLGANIGTFSRIISAKGIQVISFDVDPNCVENNYCQCVEKREINILPLLLDLTNPSPGVGWRHAERMSFIERGPVDTVIALALIHHLAITNNLPLNYIAEFFAQICDSLIIEFVPKSDSQVKRLLLNREDIFSAYSEKVFEDQFSNYFDIKTIHRIIDSERTLYFMKRKRS
ncbi:SAM-dependent methyltransferase [candidate division WS5 bacterium]|uniref:SAM-dependent methyltransferase n=1 Tax=candidate division WS5 bacterium TaxID=2093353 RepID=A0A419DEW2_9BACT|nr:MAG: SAM-dependent methyltransferase [candidate division WS5 bacterium]